MVLKASLAIIFSLLTFTTSAITVSYDMVYDDASHPLQSFACSDGKNGLLNRNFTSSGQLPTFPAIGASYKISGWNSTSCGSCWTLTYEEKSVNFLAIDHATTGFITSKSLMDRLTGNRAEKLGRIDVGYTNANSSACGM